MLAGMTVKVTVQGHLHNQIKPVTTACLHPLLHPLWHLDGMSSMAVAVWDSQRVQLQVSSNVFNKDAVALQLCFYDHSGSYHLSIANTGRAVMHAPT